MYDVLVVGCGASGAIAAICAARRGLNVAIIEAKDRGLKKLLTTGNGRCNITNENVIASHYNKRSQELFTSVYERFNNIQTLEFFKEIGVESSILDDGKIYPMSLKAASVVNNILDELDRAGVQIINDFPVNKIKRTKHFELFSGEKKLSTKAVIIACGSKAGVKTRDFESIYKALDIFNIKKNDLMPSLVQFTSGYKYLKHLNGTKLKTTATLICNNKEVKSFFGEVLFTDYGLSGIPIMNLSRYYETAKTKNYKIELDLIPNLNFNELVQLLENRRANISYKTLDKFFVGFIPKSLILPLIKDNVLNMNDIAGELSDRDVKKIAQYLKRFSIDITGTNPFFRAQVMRGGIDVQELNDDLSFKNDKNLFFAGEVIDVDGMCGGYNLQWAWSSGYLAGTAILAEKTGEK